MNVIMQDGSRKRVGEANRDELVKALVPGQILERQLIDGDIALFNRQPTLHRLSIMAHEVKVLPGRTLRLHVSIAVPYNADFDGDEMNLHVPQSLEAQAEARYLMQPKDQVLSPRDGKPIIFTMEDEVIGVYTLTKDGSFFEKDDAMRMMATVGVYELPKPVKGGKYSGKALFSMILPKGFNFEAKTSDGKMVIKNGELIEGVIDEKLIGGGGGVMLLEIYNKYGADISMDFLLKLTKLSLTVASKMGMTMSIKDYYNSDLLNKERTRIIAEVEAKANEILEKYKAGKLERLPSYTIKETLELITMAQLEEARHMAETVAQESLDS